MALGRLGILVSLFLFCVLAIQSSVRADLVLPTLEAYAAKDLSRGRKMMNASYSKEVKSQSRDSARKSTGTAIRKSASQTELPGTSPYGLHFDGLSRIVPEPSSIHVIALTLGALAVRRRRRTI